MKYLKKFGTIITLDIEESQIRALLGIVNEVSEGPFSFTDEQWDKVMLQPRSVEDELLAGLSEVIDRYNEA
jgi:hypothetical protein